MSEDVTFTAIHRSDGTFEEVYADETLVGTWFVNDGMITYVYEDGAAYEWIVRLILDDGVTFFYSIYPSDGAYWLSSDTPIN